MGFADLGRHRMRGLFDLMSAWRDWVMPAELGCLVLKRSRWLPGLKFDGRVVRYF